VVSLIPWYWDSANGVKETARLRELFPTLELQLDPNKRLAYLRGVLSISDGVGYTTNLHLPAGYPIEVPTLQVDRGEIQWLADRHVNAQTGEACLCVRSEYRLHWPHGSDLSVFIERLVRPYFAAQLFYDTHGSWPEGAARSHGPEGIIEAYRDLTAPLGNSSLSVIEKVMRVLASKRRPQGHEPCPCGSGLVLRNCHSAVLRHLRENIAPGHAAADLAMAFPSV
jgi:hypothetical protein